MNFDHTPTKEELEALYKQSKKADPSSPYYSRVNIRPTLGIGRVCLSVFLCLVISFALSVIVFLITKSPLYATLTAVLSVILAILIFLKNIIIFFVKVYQRFAPISLRNRCRYEPSCSQYMIIALKKYGLFKGLFKGLRRIFYCKPPYGGFDEP